MAVGMLLAGNDSVMNAHAERHLGPRQGRSTHEQPVTEEARIVEEENLLSIRMAIHRTNQGWAGVLLERIGIHPASITCCRARRTT